MLYNASSERHKPATKIRNCNSWVKIYSTKWTEEIKSLEVLYNMFEYHDQYSNI